MIKSMHLRAGYAAALAAGLLLAGCSSEPDYPDAPKGPQNTTSAPSTPSDPNAPADAPLPSAAAPDAAAPAANADGSYPDVNTVPTQRPTTTIQDLNQAPEGLSGAQSGTQYGEELIGGPTSNAAPPPPPEPVEELPPIPEPGVKTDNSESSNTAAPKTSTYTEPVAEAAPEPEPTPEPVAEAAPEPVAAPAAVAEAAAEPQASTAATPAPTTAPTATPQASSVQAAPLAPMQGAQQAQPVTPVGTPQPGARPFQPEAHVALAPGSVQTQTAALPQAQPAYGPNYAALAPENYGISFPQPALPPYQGYGNAQAMYRSPYASPPTNYGGATTVVGAQPQAQALQPPSNYPTYGVPTYGAPAYGAAAYGGQPVGMIYFRDGSARLSSDDRKVLRQIADMHKTYGGVVRVVGHASMRTGSMDYVSHQNANQRISEARAKAVAQQLQRYGVPQAAIQVSAVSDSQPIYSEVMPSGEAANRRAEVYLTAY